MSITAHISYQREDGKYVSAFCRGLGIDYKALELARKFNKYEDVKKLVDGGMMKRVPRDLEDKEAYYSEDKSDKWNVWENIKPDVYDDVISMRKRIDECQGDCLMMFHEDEWYWRDNEVNVVEPLSWETISTGARKYALNELFSSSIMVICEIFGRTMEGEADELVSADNRERLENIATKRADINWVYGHQLSKIAKQEKERDWPEYAAEAAEIAALFVEKDFKVDWHIAEKIRPIYRAEVTRMRERIFELELSGDDPHDDVEYYDLILKQYKTDRGDK